MRRSIIKSIVKVIETELFAFTSYGSFCIFSISFFREFMQSVSEWVQERLKAVTQRTTKAWKTINRESTPKAIVIINLREL